MWGKRRRPDEDFAREVDAHVQLEADRLVEEGLSPEAAAREARQRFGNPALARERFYYSSRSLWFDQLKQDVSTALRGIKRYPIACAIAVISLAGGIGATTTTLVLRNAIFLAPPPLYGDPAAIYQLRSPTPDSPAPIRPGRLLSTWNGDPALAGAFSASAAHAPASARRSSRVAARATVTPTCSNSSGVKAGARHLVARWPGGGDPRHVERRRLAQHVSNAKRRCGHVDLIDSKPHTVVGDAPRFWFGSMDGPVWTRLDLTATRPTRS